MADEAALAAAIAIIKGLARASTSPHKCSPPIAPTSNRTKIPENEGDAREVLELELGLLAQRIHTLEHTAIWTVNPAIPDTPDGDTAVMKPPFNDADNALQQSRGNTPRIPITSTASSSIEPTLDYDLLEGCSLEAQSKILHLQSSKVTGVNSELPGQEQEPPSTTLGFQSGARTSSQIRTQNVRPPCLHQSH
jgi:hypothetical protein